jgi:hypothetical protein
MSPSFLTVALDGVSIVGYVIMLSVLTYYIIE